MRKGFTLIELLVVIGIIVMMLVIGTVSFTAYLAETGIRLGARTVTGSFRAARQVAVSQRVATAVIFYEDPNESGDLYDAPQRVEIRRYDPVRSDDSHTLVFALRQTPEEAFELPGTLALKWAPKLAQVYVKPANEGDPLTKDGFRLIDFFPDGSSCFGGEVEDIENIAATCPANHVAIFDRATGKIVYLYVYPITSFIKETYVEAQP